MRPSFQPSHLDRRPTAAPDIGKSGAFASPPGAHKFSTSASPPGEEKEPTFTPPSFVTGEDDAGELAVDVALDPKRRMVEGSGGSMSSKSLGSGQDHEKRWQELDPVNMKLLSMPSARALFER
jgi:hypothetical protein